MKLTILSLITLALCACQRPSDPEALSRTKSNFSSPVNIGTLPDGREVKLVERDMGSKENHYIYFVDGTSTTNYSVTKSNGKTTTTRQEIIVLIDGVKYTPLEKQ